MASIELRNVTLDFPVPDADSFSIKSQVLRIGSGGLIKREARQVYVRALDSLSLSLKDGDRLGVIGPNGAGKTALLRVISGIYPPSEGTVRVEGKLYPLLDMNLGMDQESSGYDNIYLRGLALGLDRETIRRKKVEIAEFSELGDYLNLPVRTYSAGMRVRLAYSISTCIDPEVLVLDEAFGAGDAAFLEKVRNRMAGLVSQARILILASHAGPLIQRFCNHAMWLQKGQVQAFGPTEEVLQAYRQHNTNRQQQQQQNKDDRPAAHQADKRGDSETKAVSG